MSPSSPSLGLLIIPAFFMGSFYSSPASISAFAAISIVLEAVRSLASWSIIAILFYVWEELDFPRSESRVVSDLRFFFRIFISHEFRK
jgi:hypothetical protein